MLTSVPDLNFDSRGVEADIIFHLYDQGVIPWFCQILMKFHMTQICLCVFCAFSCRLVCQTDVCAYTEWWAAIVKENDLLN